MNLTSRIWVLRVRRSFLSCQRGEVPGSEVLCGVVVESESRLTKGGSALSTEGGGAGKGPLWWRGGKRWEDAGSVCPEPNFASAQAQPSERVFVFVCVFVFMIGGDTGGPKHPRPAPRLVRIPMTSV